MIVTSAEGLSNSIVSGSLMFVDKLTIVSINQNACKDSSSGCTLDSEASGVYGNIVLTETLLMTNVADDAMSITTTITLPRSTLTIRVSSVPSASASVPTSVYTTATLQDKCYQPMLPILEPCDPDTSPETTATTSSLTLINGTLVITTQQSAALPLGAHNRLKPIFTFVKSLFAFGVKCGKEMTTAPSQGHIKVGQGRIGIWGKLPQSYGKSPCISVSMLLLHCEVILAMPEHSWDRELHLGWTLTWSKLEVRIRCNFGR
jgi:hypothetical protein